MSGTTIPTPTVADPEITHNRWSVILGGGGGGGGVQQKKKKKKN